MPITVNKMHVPPSSHGGKAIDPVTCHQTADETAKSAGKQRLGSKSNFMVVPHFFPQ